MAFDAYLFIDGIEGDSTSETYTKPPGYSLKPIEIKSYGLGIEMPMVENRSATGAASVGRANFEEYETAKTLDGSSFSLLFSCLAGKHIDKAAVRVYRSIGEDESAPAFLYMEIFYKTIVITEVSVSGGGDEMPSETLKFSYNEIEYKYYHTDEKGKAAGSSSFKWSRIDNTGEKTFQ